MRVNVEDFNEIERFRDARDLVKLGMRVSIISALTGVTPHLVKKMWKDTYNQVSPSGQLPTSVHVFVKDAVTAANLSGFVAHCAMKYADLKLALTARNIIIAQQQYRRLAGCEIDINTAYYALRDVAARLVEWKHCCTCDAHYMYLVRSFPLRACPFCRLAPTSRKAA